MLKKLFLIFLLLFSTSVSAKYITIERLLNWFESQVPTQRTAAVGYVTGVLDTEMVSKICPPKDSTNGQVATLMRDLIISAVKENPELKKEFASDFILLVSKELFPCSNLPEKETKRT